MFNNRNTSKKYMNYKKIVEQNTFCPFKGDKGGIIFLGEDDLENTNDFLYDQNSLKFNINNKDTYTKIVGNILDNDSLFIKNKNNKHSKIQIGFDKKKVSSYNILSINAETNNQIFAFNIGKDYDGGSGYLNIKKSSDEHEYVDENGLITITPSINKKFTEPHYNLKLQSSQKDISHAKATASHIFRTQTAYDEAELNEIMSEGAIVLEPNKKNFYRNPVDGKLQYEMNFYLKAIDASSNLKNMEYSGILSEDNEVPYMSLIADSSSSKFNGVNFYKNVNIIKDISDISNNVYITQNGNIGFGNPTPRGLIDISQNGVIILPQQRDLSSDNIQGALRYNAEKKSFQGYKNNKWVSLGGVDDNSGTFISAVDVSSGNINKELQFYTDGIERMKIDGSGNIIIREVT